MASSNSVAFRAIAMMLAWLPWDDAFDLASAIDWDHDLVGHLARIILNKRPHIYGASARYRIKIAQVGAARGGWDEHRDDRGDRPDRYWGEVLYREEEGGDWKRIRHVIGGRELDFLGLMVSRYVVELREIV